MKRPYGIHWFRRDLRVAGNPALLANWKQSEGRVVGVFCFDKKFLARPDFSAPRFQFFLATLSALKEELASIGSDLLVLDVGPEEAFSALIDRLSRGKSGPPGLITWNRDYEPYARQRDAGMAEMLRERGIPLHHERDHLLIEPPEIYKGDDPGDGYVVYTPFSRRWMERFESPNVQSRVEVQQQGIRYLDKPAGKIFSLVWKDILEDHNADPDHLAIYTQRNAKRVSVPIPKAGCRAAIESVRAFSPKIARYGETRDFPSVAGTSHVSIYLKNGSLTVAQIIAELKLKGVSKYLNELIWREFYYHILYRFPHVEHSAFQERFRNLEWQNREDWFEAWKEGKTGFPIVDAGIRQLNTTGWMHNRVRMIVASFLTKDLLIDWRWGEKVFMERLFDGDLAPNNGGWQWAASTGCDAQPYFRIFNPLLQSQKFDPKGDYLRRFIPELAHIKDDSIHDPPPLDRGDYPQPIIDHATQRQLALNLFQRSPVVK